jgi:hypothetical protein
MHIMGGWDSFGNALSERQLILPDFPALFSRIFSLVSVFGRRSFSCFMLHDILRFFPHPKAELQVARKNPPDIHAAVQNLNFVFWGKNPFSTPPPPPANVCLARRGSKLAAVFTHLVKKIPKKIKGRGFEFWVPGSSRLFVQFSSLLRLKLYINLQISKKTKFGFKCFLLLLQAV